MSSADEELEAAIRALGQVFISKLPGKLAEIEDAKDAFQRDPDNKEHEALLHRLLHTMAGSAGTFGFADMGTKARALESQLKVIYAGRSVGSPAEFKSFASMLKATFKSLELQNLMMRQRQ